MVTKYYICSFEEWNSEYKLFLPQDVSEDFYWDYAGVLVALYRADNGGTNHSLSLLDRVKAKGEEERYSMMICVVHSEVYFAMRNFFQNCAQYATFNSPVDIEVVFLEHSENCVEYDIVTIEDKNVAYILRKQNIAA